MACKLEWQWTAFDELSLEVLYQIMRLRQQVFIVEQNCVYVDADEYDFFAYHLIGWQGNSEKMPSEQTSTSLLAYMRILPPQIRYPELSMGRILTAPTNRGKGMGIVLVEEGLRCIRQHFGDVAIRLSAQQYLKHFYERFGFKQIGNPYKEDGIPHIKMVREQKTVVG